MKYLVTGCAGFIGSNLVASLLSRGDQVVGIDNFNDYYNPQIKEKNIQPWLSKAEFKLYRADIRDYKKLAEIFKLEKFDKIIHLAARAGVRASIADPLLYTEVNVNGTVNLLELAKQYDIQNFIFASSSSVYGEREAVPFRETDEIKPISPYAATKKAGELLGYTYHHLYQLPFTALRFFTVYGPKGRPDMAPYKFMKKISQGEVIEVYGDGESLRDYTYVDDIVDGIIKAVDKNLNYEIINLGNSQPVKLKDFIKTWEKIIGRPAKLKYINKQLGDVSQTYADTTKAKKLLAWQASTSLADGLEKMYQYFKK